MFNIVKSQIGDLFFHENGNFVIQKCLEIYQGEDFYFLLDQIQLYVDFLCEIDLTLCHFLVKSIVPA